MLDYGPLTNPIS